jgi:NTE family protein
MGVTIVHKSNGVPRKKDAKVALVLAGGAVTGGAFKAGALKALDDFLLNRKTTDFDLYVGLSAGAVLAAPLAAGVTPAEMLRSIEGTSEQFSPMGPMDFYNPNLREFVQKPLDYLVDLLTYMPSCLLNLGRQSPGLFARLREPIAALVDRPSWSAAYEVIAPMAETIFDVPQAPFALDYLPSGVFDNATIERYLRVNMARNGIPNDFRALHRRRDNELYIAAMNLDTADRVVFGHDEDASVTISEAVQASTALPGFYKPARIRGRDYVDGGVRRTANIDVAIEHGADLIICYNPFRPFSNRLVRRYITAEKRYAVHGSPMADRGLLTILNQVLRTMLHSRLQLGLRQYREDPSFQGDIIVVEPTERDLTFFQMTPVDFSKRQEAGRHGYVSATQSIENHYDVIERILRRHGLLMTRKDVREGLERMHGGAVGREYDHEAPVLERQVA